MAREIYEAKKLIAINEDLGLKFHDDTRADVERMGRLEIVQRRRLGSKVGVINDCGCNSRN
jgi:hypothetical protein